MLKESDDLAILGVTFDFKMTFEKHLCSLSRSASQRLGILRKSWQVFHDRLLLGRCFRGFVLPVLEYCSAVWFSAADTHLRQLDCVVSGASFLTGGVFECDLAHRRSIFYKYFFVNKFSFLVSSRRFLNDNLLYYYFFFKYEFTEIILSLENSFCVNFWKIVY